MKESSTYGEKHRSEKKKKLQQTGYRCEVSGQPGTSRELHAHHSQPRSLDFMDLGDSENNYIIMLEEYHMLLHKVCNVTNQELLAKRRVYAKRVLKDPFDEKEKEKLRKADDQLVPDFIGKMMNKLSYEMRDIVMNNTLVNAFKTNTESHIKIYEQKITISQLERQVEKLQKRLQGKIIQLVQKEDIAEA